MCCSPWGCKESDMTAAMLNNSKLSYLSPDPHLLSERQRGPSFCFSQENYTFAPPSSSSCLECHLPSWLALHWVIPGMSQTSCSLTCPS